MIQQAALSSPFAPVYRDDLARTIGALQQLQLLCARLGNDASLTDVLAVVRAVQDEFGEKALLETVIQSLVGQHIRQQVATRRKLHEVEEVLV